MEATAQKTMQRAVPDGGEQGRIVKVAGPLVVAVGIPEAKMYEVVKVGQEKLIGEVIRIEGEEVFIQVYEETAGIGPGEPVYLTGSPLTVELGPGLVSGIYDGIQRPLTALQKKSGEFISRGIEARALDSEKKWHFKPSKRKGDEVEVGDILGEVQETEILSHKIMVPPSVENGSLSFIVPEGDYPVDEVIAKVGNQEIKMAHKWPIRQPRPVKDKLLPSKALITGQRVIDTLFPIAKGGAGCVPGPFGSGKCVSGDTLVMMGNGRIVTMEDIFKEGSEKGRLLRKDGIEEIYDIKGLGNPSTISLEKDKFESCESVTAYKGMTDSTIEILTRTGKKVEITPVHRLFVLEDGEVKRKMAKDIKKGDYLIAPRKIPLKLEDQQLNYGEILRDNNLFSVDEAVNEAARSWLKELLREREVPPIFRQYLNRPRRIPLDVLSLISEKRVVKLTPKRIASYHGKTIKLPERMSAEFGEFLGYIMADGNLKKSSYSIRFYSASRELLDRFSIIVHRLFGIDAYIYPHPKGNLFIAQIDCKALFDILKGLGVPFRQKAKHALIPECVLMSSDKTLMSFIWAYINCDGSVDVRGSRIEITSVSRKIIEQISFALLRFGLVASLGKTKKDGTHRLTISNSWQLKVLLKYGSIGKAELLKKATKERGWSSLDSFPMPGYCKKFLKDSKIISRLKNERKIHLEQYLYSKQNVGTNIFRKIVDAVSSFTEVPKRIVKFAAFTENVFFDKVAGINNRPLAKAVYDVEVPSLGNFIGGHGALLLSNTVVQHQITRWSDAEVIIFCATGERGNEVADLLKELPTLTDPKTGRPLMERTVLIANTSNMPVAAREASVYTGITIGEYFRDMGYSVALLADSTSRWAEALREISGRLEEMPGDEGYPAYLGSRTAAFYERAGYVKCQGRDNREGFLTVVGAVSPPGGDLSEPVTQNTLRVTKVFWALDAQLAYKRHFPAINWLTSYTLYDENLKEFFDQEGGENFTGLKKEVMEILQKEAELEEIVRLVGVEALSQQDQFLLEVARIIREDFLHQNAFLEIDTYTSLKKQYLMLKTIMRVYEKGKGLIEQGKQNKDVLSEALKEKLAKMKLVPEGKPEQFELLLQEVAEMN